MTTSKVTPPDLLATLQDRGYRLTGPRREIVTLLGRKHEGFTAEEIAGELPAVGRATVYRTIKLLLDTGVVCKLALPDGAPRYSLSRFGHHHHTVCTQCGTVSDFRGTTIERLLRSLRVELGGQIVGHRIEFYIVCPSCLGGAKG